MRINVLRLLLVPWFVFFLLATGAIVFVGVKFHIRAQTHFLFPASMGAAIFICLILNLRTLRKAGIWIAYSLPLSLRYTSAGWLLRAALAVGVAAAFYAVGQLAWVPLFWQAFVIPFVFAVALFVIVRSLLGPILKWAANVSFGRAFTFVLSLPVFLGIPVTAVFLGETIVSAYQASRPVPVIVADSGDAEAEVPPAPAAPSEADPAAQPFREMAESGRSCAEHGKEIQAALDPKRSEDVVFWAIKAVRCAEMRSVVALPRLADLMIKHPSPRVRAEAIRTMPRFGSENVRQIAYLLVKRISEKEAPEVIEAASAVLPPLGEDERKWTTNRLKNLLDSPAVSTAAARVLIDRLKREDLVVEYVSANLAVESDARDRAVGMICLLSDSSRKVAAEQIDQVVAAVQTGRDDNPVAIEALDCLGQPGLQAIRQEVAEPQKLDKTVAAKALADMDIAGRPEALETAESCSNDENEEVRRWCSQSLGKIGAPALPKIIDLLSSGDPALKNAGQNALHHFQDKDAKDELQRIRAENSGWMANKHKLEIAEAVTTALTKIQNQDASPNPSQDRESSSE